MICCGFRTAVHRRPLLRKTESSLFLTNTCLKRHYRRPDPARSSRYLVHRGANEFWQNGALRHRLSCRSIALALDLLQEIILPRLAVRFVVVGSDDCKHFSPRIVFNTMERQLCDALRSWRLRTFLQVELPAGRKGR